MADASKIIPRKIERKIKTLEMLQKLPRKCIQIKNRCNRNLVIARYIGL